MSIGLEKIKAIGAQKIHESTHIYKQHIQAILHESFEGMNELQLTGFISIIEREYDVDLSDLREKAKEYFKEETPKVVEDKKIFIVPKKKPNLIPFYLFVVLVIFVSFAYFKVYPDYMSKKDVVEVDNTAIENAKNNISQSTQQEVSVKEESSPKPENISPEADEVKVEKKVEKKVEAKKIQAAKPVVIKSTTAQDKLKKESEATFDSFKIMPKSKLWVGYIDLGTYKRYQRTFSDELSLDPNKDWLLSFGHGNVNIDIDGQILEFRDRRNVRFVYEDGVLTKIDYKTFKSLNKGSKW